MTPLRGRASVSDTSKTDIIVDLKEIRLLIDLMKKNGVAVLKMEKEGFKIT